MKEKRWRKLGLVIVVVLLLFLATLALLRFRGWQRAGTARDPVEFVWVGAVTTETARVTVRTVPDSLVVRLLVSESESLADPVVAPLAIPTSLLDDRISSFVLQNLEPETTYYFGVEVDGIVDEQHTGSFRTFGEAPFSFTFALSSCAVTGSTDPVFTTIQRHEPLFFLHMGDLHYADIAANDARQYQAAYRAVLASPVQEALYRHVPIVYTWDDHDYGPNNSDRTAPGREAARLTYQQYVPHYPLVSGQGNVPIFQAFTVGRIRFLVTDTRSERTPNSAPDLPGKTILGELQKAWLQEELLAAKGRYPLVVWVNSVPWLAPPQPGADHWGGFTVERRELADFIVENEIDDILMVSGDAHMLALDDGRNNQFATEGGPGFPIFQVGALDRFGSYKGGPYSHGSVTGGGHFGLVQVEDNGGRTVTVTLSGRNRDDDVLMAHTFVSTRDPFTVAVPDIFAGSPPRFPLYVYPVVVGAVVLLLVVFVFVWRRR